MISFQRTWFVARSLNLLLQSLLSNLLYIHFLGISRRIFRIKLVERNSLMRLKEISQCSTSFHHILFSKSRTLLKRLSTKCGIRKMHSSKLCLLSIKKIFVTRLSVHLSLMNGFVFFYQLLFCNNLMKFWSSYKIFFQSELENKLNNNRIKFPIHQLSHNRCICRLKSINKFLQTMVSSSQGCSQYIL